MQSVAETIEAVERAHVVAEARRWINTPYHHDAALIGVGVDCARLLLEVYSAVGLIDRFDPGRYPPDWHLHRSEERYVDTILRFAVEYDWRAAKIEPGDVVVWRYGRTFSHGGICTDWPRVIHAFAPNMIVEEAYVPGSMMDGREMRAFSLWRKAV